MATCSCDGVVDPEERTAAAATRPDPGGGVPRKLVSHRLRGFGRYENCRTALERALATPVPCLEIDTRVAADGRIFVYHNPRPRSEHGDRPRFARHDSSVLRRVRYPCGEELLELDEAFGLFARRRYPGQRLCIDMKDCGFEGAHIALAARHGVESSITWMAWVPESLARLRALGTTAPLLLAHCNLMRLAALGEWFDLACNRIHLKMLNVVLRGAGHARQFPGFAHGFQHGLVCARLPAGVEDLLAASGGGICVHYTLVSDTLRRYCRAAGLQLWVWRAGTPASFARFALDAAIDMIFCDDAPGVLREATKPVAVT
jgi:glycerophosphoryl diester phosphodiesterase